jgi:uncharacterized hydrophobic protein (TIGR00271 family)
MSRLKKVVLLKSAEYDSASYENILIHLQVHYSIRAIQMNMDEYKDNPLDNCVLLLLLSDEEIKSVLDAVNMETTVIGILPTAKNKITCKSFGISKDIFEAVEDALDDSCYIRVDMLRCNGVPVLSSVIIGETWGLHCLSCSDNSGFWKKAMQFMLQIRDVKLKPFTLTTAKNQTISTAALGVMVLEHNFSSVSSNAIKEHLSIKDGKLAALILSPKSIFSYLWFLFLARFLSRFSFHELPNSVGIIKTQKLTISSKRGMDYTIDGVAVSSRTIDLEIYKNALHISIGRLIQELQEQFDDEKEMVRVQNLPSPELSKILSLEPIPFFAIATEADYRSLFITLKDGAESSLSFLVLMGLSTMLATIGLFLNSSSVIIGAMILAPLMAPIISLSMGLARSDGMLIRKSAWTLLIGLVLAMGLAAFLSMIIPVEILTSEIHGRLNPSLLDLGVAIVSGIAGAYAHARESIAKSMAGVAIAVALVPPLAVTGIGIGWMEWHIISGSFLLFVTNLVGISLASSITFLILGFVPIKRAKAGITATMIALGLIAIPLSFSFKTIVKESHTNKVLNRLSSNLEKDGIELSVKEVRIKSDVIVITAEMKSTALIKDEIIILLKSQLQEQLDQAVQLELNQIRIY